MITILRWSENRFVQADKIERHCLINLVNPEKDELKKLTDEMLIPSDFLTDPLDIDERSRIETENGFLLIVLRLPKYNKASDIPFTTSPAGIILTNDDTIVLISSSDIMEVLNLSESRLKGVGDGKRSSVILHIFLKTALLFLKYLKEINRQTGEIENELQKSLKNKELIKLLNIEKGLVFFITSLKSNELMMERLMKTELLTIVLQNVLQHKKDVSVCYSGNRILIICKYAGY